MNSSDESKLVKSRQTSQEALRLHAYYKGKIQMLPKCPIRDFADFSLWYTPGVAAPCQAIKAAPELAYVHTNKANTIAIISDGTRVLGLGDIGPLAGLPVMEGKALLFKYLGGVDAVPLCLATKDPEELIRTVKILEPAFGGVNLEDIAQPKCFRILDRLRQEMTIPIWHDDQQGTAAVVVAALSNALKVVGKDLAHIRIALIGTGAANIATYRLLLAAGAMAGSVIACDSKGILHPGRQDIEQQQDLFQDKWRLCRDSNTDGISGGIAEAMRDADVAIAFSACGPGIIRPEWVKRMATQAIVFACANPIPEIWPWEAREAGASIVATGRGDFPNQVNNSLIFPAVFRGALDVRARAITDTMALAAARELAFIAEASGLQAERIVPRMDEWEIYPRVAAATAMQAQQENVARQKVDHAELLKLATDAIRGAREAIHALMREGFIASVPPAEVIETTA